MDGAARSTGTGAGQGAVTMLAAVGSGSLGSSGDDGCCSSGGYGGVDTGVSGGRLSACRGRIRLVVLQGVELTAGTSGAQSRVQTATRSSLRHSRNLAKFPTTCVADDKKYAVRCCADADEEQTNTGAVSCLTRQSAESDDYYPDNDGEDEVV